MSDEYRSGQGSIIPSLFLGLGGTGSRIVDRSGESEDVYAKAESVIVAVDGTTHAKRPLGDAERAGLLKHLVTT